LQVPLMLWNTKAFYQKVQSEDFVFGAFFGIFIVMILYNFVIFFFLKDITYLYYIFYLLTTLVVYLNLFGFAKEFLWPDFEDFSLNLAGFFIFAAYAFLLIFPNNFLETKKYLPRVRKYINGLIIVFAFLSFFSLIFGPKLPELIPFSALVSVVIIISMAFYTYNKGYKPARYFIMAWLIYLLSIFLNVLSSFAIIPGNLILLYSLQVGASIEITLISLALADRFNLLKIQISKTIILLKEEIEQRLQAEEELKKINDDLDNRVMQRTTELEVTNEELNQTIDELKTAQAMLVQSEKMASLGILTAGIAHEINNPINYINASIIGLNNIINDILSLVRNYEKINQENCNEKIKEIEVFKKQIEYNDLIDGISILTKNIEIGVKRTSEIVKGLNTFSRSDDGSKYSFDINTNIDLTLMLLHNQFDDYITINRQYGQIPEIMCYPGKINQVFMNLLSNSIDSIISKPEKNGSDEILIKTSLENANCIKIEICDSGIGIPEKILNNIFEPFFTTKDVGKGTGLGLAISTGIIKNHKGQIKVRNNQEKGVTFTILLPVKDQ
jgi:two-component system NtrC family sensor kinase